MQKGGEVLPKRKSELCLYSRVKLWKIDSPPKLSIQLAKVSEPMSAQVCFSVARGMLNHFYQECLEGLKTRLSMHQSQLFVFATMHNENQ